MIAVSGVIVLVAAIAVTGFLIALHVLPTGLSPLIDPVSRYALTRFGFLYRAATVAAAVAGAGAAVSTAARYAGVGAVVTIALLVLFALSRALIGFFPMDDPAAEKSSTGAVHTILAFAAFGSITAAAFVAGGVFHDGGDPVLANVSTATGVAMALGTIGMLIASRTIRTRSLFGAAERLIYLGFISWFIAVGVTAVSG